MSTPWCFTLYLSKYIDLYKFLVFMLPFSLSSPPPNHTITYIHTHIKKKKHTKKNYFKLFSLTSLVDVSCWSELFLLMKKNIYIIRILYCIAYSFSRDVKNWNNFWRNFGRLYLFDWHFFFFQMMYNNFIKLFL